MTLVVNFYGGPGSGKSTTAAGTFYELKRQGVNCELAREYAKDMVWEGRNHMFDDQIYIFAKQRKRIRDLQGKVDVILTDSPLSLSLIYGKHESKQFHDLVRWESFKFWNLNLFVKRDIDRAFNPSGRFQTEEEAQILDVEIAGMLDGNQQPYKVIGIDPDLAIWFIKETLNG